MTNSPSMHYKSWTSAQVKSLRKLARQKLGVSQIARRQKGFGFIEPESGGRDVFVYISALEGAGLNHLAEGQRVNFDVEKAQR
jgi:CspA family cold shock protein